MYELENIKCVYLNIRWWYRCIYDFVTKMEQIQAHAMWLNKYYWFWFDVGWISFRFLRIYIRFCPFVDLTLAAFCFHLKKILFSARLPWACYHFVSPFIGWMPIVHLQLELETMILVCLSALIAQSADNKHWSSNIRCVDDNCRCKRREQEVWSQSISSVYLKIHLDFERTLHISMGPHFSK